MAEPGDVPPVVSAALRDVQRFEDERDRQFRALLGFGVRANPAAANTSSCARTVERLA